MRNSGSDDKRVLGRMSLVGVAAGGVLVLALWALYLAALLGDVDLLRSMEPPKPLAVTTYWWVAVVGSVVGIGVALLSWVRTRKLADRGVSVEGRPVKIGGAATSGMRSVTFAYAAGTEQRTVIAEVMEDVARQYTKATRVRVVYDPANPGNARVMDLHADPQSGGLGARVGEAVKDSLAEGVERAIMGAVLVASALALFGVWRLVFGDGPGAEIGTGLMCVAAAMMMATKIVLERRRGRGLEFGGDLRMVYLALGVLVVAAVGMLAWGGYSRAESGRIARESEAADTKLKDERRAAEAMLNPPPRNPAPAGDMAKVTGSYQATGKLAQGPSVWLYANGRGTLNLLVADPANPGKQTLTEEEGRWTCEGQNVTFTLDAMAMARNVPAKQMTQRFVLGSDGKKLVRADGLEFEREP